MGGLYRPTARFNLVWKGIPIEGNSPAPLLNKSNRPSITISFEFVGMWRGAEEIFRHGFMFVLGTMRFLRGFN